MSDNIKETFEGLNAIKEIVAKNKEQYNLDMMSSYIKDNVLEFKYNDNLYRMRLLNNEEKEELYNLKNKKLSELLQDKSILSQKQLSKLYKEKELIDIPEIDHKIEAYEKDLLNERMVLGQALEEKKPDIILLNSKDKIEKIEAEIFALNLQKKDVFEMSLENQLEQYSSRVLAYLSTEINKDNKWEKAFKTYEEFAKIEQEFMVKVLAYSLFINYR